MTVKSISFKVLQDIKQTLREHPSGITIRDLAYALDLSISYMYKCSKLLQRMGLIEPAGFTPEPRKKGLKTQLWMWTKLSTTKPIWQQGGDSQ